MNPANPMNEEREPQRFEFIDALRGWAILGVLWCHAGLFQKVPGFFEDAVTSGSRGVQLFYLVSAFALFWSMNSRKSREIYPLRNYFVRRFFRIAPMFYIAVALYMYTGGIDRVNYAPEGVGAFHVMTTMTFVNGWIPSHINSVVPGGWSVAVESNFYFLLPLIFLFVKNLRSALWLLWGVLVAVWGMNRGLHSLLQKVYANELSTDNPLHKIYQFMLDNYEYSWLPNQMGVFALGVVFYFLFIQNNLSKFDKRDSFLLLVLSLSFMWPLLREYHLGFMPNHFLFGAAFLLFVWSLSIHPWVFFVNPVVRYIGQISFSLYLLHFAFFNSVRELLGAGFFVPEKNIFRYAAGFIVLLALSVVAASVSYYLIEVPGIALGRKLIKTWERERPAA